MYGASITGAITVKYAVTDSSGTVPNEHGSTKIVGSGRDIVLKCTVVHQKIFAVNGIYCTSIG
jgi:hypothetical protein